MKIIILVGLYILTISSCKNNDGKKITNNGVTYTSYNAKMKDTTYLDIEGNEYKFFGRIPDSLRTPEQKKLAKVIVDVLTNGVVVKNNRQILKLTKQECLAKGLPAEYYETLKNNIRTNNSYNEAYGIKNVDKMEEKLDSNLNTLK
ncbi:hypothetical protein [Pedobacter sp. L105]|uniref:hypothetical protein n=1 Tax=Pedobacter sp. L105 TaxID=1641871 RepID=UPI00131B0EA3|nr:hypothetical protein [Pedobacter sp. L105]